MQIYFKYGFTLKICFYIINVDIPYNIMCVGNNTVLNYITI